jgi:uncharacterized DUF497 family protein
LVVDEHRINHIARHQITIEEAQEVVSRDYAYIRGREDRWLLIGKTKGRRLLTVVLGERSQKDTYGLVTARPASREESSLYKERPLEEGGQQE